MLGAQSVNPNIKVKIIWVNTWFDPGKEADAAKALLDQGADILMQHTDSPAAMQVAAQRERCAFGQDSDMIKFGPKTQLTAIINNWAPYYVERVQAVLDGKWKSDDTWGGLETKMVMMAPYTNMPDDVKKMAMETEAAITAGTLHPFKCPVMGQDGKAGRMQGRHASRRRPDPRHELLRQGRRRQDSRQVARCNQASARRRGRAGSVARPTQAAEFCSRSAAALCRRIRSSTSSPGIRPSSTTHRPPTITRSALCAPHSTSAASGSPWPEKRSSSSLKNARSAIVALLDLAERRTADAGRRARGRPAQRVAVADLGDAVAGALQQERGAHLLHEIGGIVGRRAVDAEADAHAGGLHVADRTAARRQRLVAAGAVADRRSRQRQPPDFIGVEMDAVREPGPLAEPAAILQIVERTAAVDFLAEAVLVLGFGEMGVQPHVVPAPRARRSIASARS